MDIAQEMGPSERVALYCVPDHELPTGSTLGGPKVCAVIKATGALEKVYSIDRGEVLFGTLVLHHWDEQTGMNLAPLHPGTFTLHPEHQEHEFTLSNDVHVHEDIFVLSGAPHQNGAVDTPAVYYTVALCNESGEEQHISTYAFCELRGNTAPDVVTTYDPSVGALVAWNASHPDHARIFGCSEKPTSYETTLDYAMAASSTRPRELLGTTNTLPSNPLGVLHLSHTLGPGESARFYYLLSFSEGGHRGAVKTYRACPSAEEALARTRAYYHDVLGRAVVLTPDPQVNRGVLWAKANMLRVETKAPTGWCSTNDPTRSNNSVARDTAWFAFGADYLTPQFAQDSLLTYVRLQEDSGKIVEYYDIRTNKTEDYGLNINDDTPLLILALWHHYNVTGDEDFLQQVYPAAAKAARYILSQRNEQGLVWCTATGTANWGICSWRNVIQDYRLSGATTEVNAECYAALLTTSHMARVLDKHDESAEFAAQAAALKDAINTHLYNPENGLYYLNIDVDGHPRSDITSDLVFPVMFGVADDKTAAHIIARLSDNDFWTEAGIRTAPRNSPAYSPDQGWGLLGGVWVGVSFWYAFAAAKHAPDFMDHALATSFQNYSRDPRRNNTVPGQFSEWLDGETLVNRGMMLSPWFPPRYLWAAIEGAAGLNLSAEAAWLYPHLAAEWKWMGVQNLPYRGRWLTWFVARTPDVHLYTNYHFQESAPYTAYEEDISAHIHVTGDAACGLGLRQHDHLLLFVGNTAERTLTTALRVEEELSGAYRCRLYDSLANQWVTWEELVPAETLHRGLAVQLESKGFWVLDLRQEV
jgi:hypothetical protein